MATGDQQDILYRLFHWLPTRWFPSNTGTRLNAVLSGYAAVYAKIHDQIAYGRLQTRIATATDGWLDLIAQDFFGYKLRRNTNEASPAYSRRIRDNLFLEKGTRHGLVHALTLLTGQIPGVFEPARTTDTGGYNLGGVGYGVAGGYGDLTIPFEFFVTAYVPHASGGIAGVQGYAHPGQVYAAVGGYGVGAIEYASLGMVASGLGATDVTRLVQDVKPAATIGWLAVVFGLSPYGPRVEPLGELVLDVDELGPDASPAPLGQFLLGSNILGGPGTAGGPTPTGIPADKIVVSAADAHALRVVMDNALSLMGQGDSELSAGILIESPEQAAGSAMAQLIGLLAGVDAQLASLVPAPTPAPTTAPATPSDVMTLSDDLAAANSLLSQIFSLLNTASTPAQQAAGAATVQASGNIISANALLQSVLTALGG